MLPQLFLTAHTQVMMESTPKTGEKISKIGWKTCVFPLDFLAPCREHLLCTISLAQYGDNLPVAVLMFSNCCLIFNFMWDHFLRPVNDPETKGSSYMRLKVNYQQPVDSGSTIWGRLNMQSCPICEDMQYLAKKNCHLVNKLQIQF